MKCRLRELLPDFFQVNIGRFNVMTGYKDRKFFATVAIDRPVMALMVKYTSKNTPSAGQTAARWDRHPRNMPNRTGPMGRKLGMLGRERS